MGGEHMAGDVPGRSGKGQDGKREKYQGCYECHGCQLMPYLKNNGQEKTLWTTGNEPQ
jgi:hypothetical protein